MTYQKGRYYNDNTANAVNNKCLQIVNPLLQKVVIKKNGQTVKEDELMISKDGAIMAEADRPLWNSSTFDKAPDTETVLEEGNACDHAIFVGKNKGGIEVIVENDSYQSLPEKFDNIYKSDYNDRPSAYQHAMQIRRSVWVKTVEYEKEQQFEKGMDL